MIQELRNVTDGLPLTQMLHFVLKEQFPDEVLVTASLKSPSVIVLKFVSEIDPTIPIVFCQPLPIFPESKEYRTKIIKLLGLTNVSVKSDSDPLTEKRAFRYCEKLWNDSPRRGKFQETIHLNNTLKPYKCWMKAAYHDGLSSPKGHQIQSYGGMVIIDVLKGWTREAVDRFMADNKLPYHPKMSSIKKPVRKPPSEGPVVGFQFG